MILVTQLRVRIKSIDSVVVFQVYLQIEVGEFLCSLEYADMHDNTVPTLPVILQSGS